jgi:hypothetical protein
MNKPKKAYSAYQLISVATVANTLARSRSIAGLESLQQLAEAVTSGSLCADLYTPHDPCFNGGNSDLIGKPTSNSHGIWRRLATKSAERYKGDVDDFRYPSAASTWHLLADDVFEFANNSALNARAAAAMRELAIRYKAELGDLQGDEVGPMTTRQKLQPYAAPEREAATPAPVKDETTEERRARWLEWFGKGERGALQRVYERELLTNPKADRSYMGKQIEKAKQEKAITKQGGAMFGQLVQDGTRIN